MLVFRGYRFLDNESRFLLLPIALLIGSCKALFILDKVAVHAVRRIERFDDNTCLGAVFSWKSWMLVMMMMALGILLRQSMLPRPLLGTLYVAIGWALFFSSRHGWLAWYRKKRS